MPETKNHHSQLSKVTFAGLLITMGIVFGDIGTSPLYVVKAIISGADKFDQLLVYGALSLVFWTLTLQTTLKYVIITLRADNHGEGGIFALFALMKKKSTWAATLTMIGGSALLADGVITPSITVSSSIEGLRMINPQIPVIPVVLFIISALFFVQQFGTKFIGKSFGPIMVIWFGMLAVLGFTQIITYPEILNAVNPVYAFNFLTQYPKGFILLGAVFLCTTGAEALYSDLGHCGIKNIRISWIFVKLALLLNYFGQGAWLMNHPQPVEDLNPFYSIMPSWFLFPGILISTAAAVIASQALITGSYTLISEAVSMNFWPKIKVLHPTTIKGQVYIPFVNWLLWVSVCFVVLFFQESSNMEAAYGLSITITMMMTSLLLLHYLYQKNVHFTFLIILGVLFGSIETSFLIANLHKFANGGWFSIALACAFLLIMLGWFFGRRIKNRHISFSNINKYLHLFEDLSKDKTIPQIATNLVYIIKANELHQIESKIMYSIFNKQPKRAQTYWLLHVDTVGEPDTFSYEVNQFIPGTLIRIDFHLGFKIEPRINLYFKEVLKDLVASGEIKLNSSYESLKKHHFPADFLFVNLDRVMTQDYKLSPWETMIMGLHAFARLFSINDVKALGLDSSSVIEEKVPISVERPLNRKIQRVE
ncbi:kup system potassium uptake protein [Aquipluma nitroreducens]|uniref:Probable potassium transport system protein Kup n=1 Tax=Aquipluma nitroreducens TaxID=2010828 RepID=A0A5K7S7Y6_9BACT|nr:KUP/HAK/KT family potassium transporter [Aquipluma nitroreducens]BBE17681.1 kup system potassium uptake protein [Aquipluma nitroreducens]